MREMTAGLAELLVDRARRGGEELPPLLAVGEEGGRGLAAHQEQAPLSRVNCTWRIKSNIY